MRRSNTLSAIQNSTHSKHASSNTLLMDWSGKQGKRFAPQALIHCCSWLNALLSLVTQDGMCEHSACARSDRIQCRWTCVVTARRTKRSLLAKKQVASPHSNDKLLESLTLLWAGGWLVPKELEAWAWLKLAEEGKNSGKPIDLGNHAMSRAEHYAPNIRRELR